MRSAHHRTYGLSRRQSDNELGHMTLLARHIPVFIKPVVDDRELGGDEYDSILRVYQFAAPLFRSRP